MNTRVELKTKRISEPALLHVYWVKQFRVHCVKREKMLDKQKLWVAYLMLLFVAFCERLCPSLIL